MRTMLFNDKENYFVVKCVEFDFDASIKGDFLTLSHFFFQQPGRM
jgi:hypothetical protein